MRISELISQLERTQELHGELEVKIGVTELGYLDIDRVFYKPDTAKAVVQGRSQR